VTEFCGIPGCGKTQLCMQLACNVQIPKRFGGAWEGEAVYIDTEGSFMAERSLSIAEGTVEHMQLLATRENERRAKKGQPALAPPPSALDLQRGIHVCRAFDSAEQLACIKALPMFLREHPRVHLLVLDSAAYHFRRGFADMGLRARLLLAMAQELLQIANEFQLAVVVTNQVTTKPGDSSSSLAPALGESWAHACTQRVMLDWQGAGRVASLLKSPSLRPGSVPYRVTQHGIQDVPMTAQQQQQQQQMQQQQQHPQMQAQTGTGAPVAGTKRPFGDGSGAGQ